MDVERNLYLSSNRINKVNMQIEQINSFFSQIEIESSYCVKGEEKKQVGTSERSTLTSI